MNIDHISLVTKFLAGGGPTDYGAGGKPLLFCGAEAGVHQPWDTSIVKDHEGKNVVTDRDLKTKMPTKYLNLGLAFMGVSRNPKANAFWMSKFNGYDLDYGGDISLCAENPKYGRLRYAKVAKATEPNNYPKAGVEDPSKALDKLMPISATLYHEPYHLADPANTPDQNCASSSSQHVTDVTSALEQLQAFAILSNSGCNETIKYFYSGDVIVGVYAGSGLAGQGVLSTVLEKLSTRIKDDGSVAESWSVEMCSNSSARYSLSVLVNTKGEFGAVQRGLQASKNGTCFSTETEIAASDWETVTYLAASASSITSTANPNKLTSYRATACRTIQVVSGDSCASLATQCGITAAQFTKYNSDPSLCSGLTPGKHVCCSPGTLPDFTPKPSADGYCYSYLVKSGDSCASLAAANDLTNAKIESFNKKTWGWNGCEKLFAKYKICLSTGYPPMPATIPNAVCGPQVNDTVKAPPGTDLSTLNECPLNACCNIWGQCGTTGDFCTPSNSSTGAPGTAAPGKNGCISNCGTNIVTSSAPGKTYNIAYFEAFNWKL
ncbi:hypothetical protein LT330_003556 [Penicillium expansum]|nr:hypothetical protein LT330_003556 [Penicillium expansum]